MTLSLLHSPLLSLPLTSRPPIPPLLLKVGPLNPAREPGERCKLPEWGVGQSPGRKRIFWHILCLLNASRCNNFNDFHTGMAVGQTEVAV